MNIKEHRNSYIPYKYLNRYSHMHLNWRKGNAITSVQSDTLGLFQHGCGKACWQSSEG
jgi:hypothetical protein